MTVNGCEKTAEHKYAWSVFMVGKVEITGHSSQRGPSHRQEASFIKVPETCELVVIGSVLYNNWMYEVCVRKQLDV